MVLIAAFILGIAGSLHCIGMCGPLVASVHAMKPKNSVTSELLYHAGRILVYGSLGLVAGFIGSVIGMFGTQRYIALVAGTFMLLMVVFPFLGKYLGIGKVLLKLRTFIAASAEKHGHRTHFILGVLNGLLPCGLVYAALAGAMANASAWSAIIFMMVFGLGTAPALLLVGRFMQQLIRKRKKTTARTLQVALSALALLVLLRGANLGIPYLSPHAARTNQNTCKVECCKH